MSDFQWYPVYPVMCFLAIFLVLLPAPWHFKARNTGTLIYITWTVIGNIIFGVNTIVWNGNWEDHAPVWCDISVKIIIGQSVGLTAASLCINRKLYNIASVRTVSISAKSRRNDAIVDILLGVVFPCVIMALSYVVQGQRYNLIEDIGCWPNMYYTPLAIALITIWPIIISVASFIYCSLSIRAFLKTRQQFKQVLTNSNSGINMSRYFRLMALASTEMCFSLPVSLWLFINNMKQPIMPWVSWEDLHYKFSYIPRYPMILVKSAPSSFTGFLINLWALPAGGFIFFCYFGLGGETLSEYRRLFWRLVEPYGFKPSPPKPSNNNQFGSFPARTIDSSVATESRGQGRFPSLPDLDDALEKSSADVDLEAAKPKSQPQA